MGKLARIEKAEAEYMQNHKSKEEKSAANRLEEGADDCAPEVKKKKKKRKREKNLDESIAEPDTIDVIKCDGEEGNIENEEPDGEIKTKKKKSKKSKKSDEISANEFQMLLPSVEETSSKKKKKSKKKKLKGGSD